MKSILNIKGVKTLTSKDKAKLTGGGPDLCYSWSTFYREYYCCGNQCSGALRM